ncbi:hypothetical protein [Streptomyces sp. NPDC089919]|uniref:hypothetical protein n=1 Tax=Streptomyces sp. NPDC089919 TaxID=3155188 RepID=UPI003449125A
MKIRRALTGLAVPALLLATSGVADAADRPAADPFASCAKWEPYPVSRLHTELLGLPETIPAATWTKFTFRVKNTSQGPLKAVALQVDAGVTQYSPVRADRKIAVQWWDKAAATWRAMPAGHLAFQTVPGGVKAGATKDVKMRIKVAGGPGEAFGDAVQDANYIAPDNTCGRGGNMDLYTFTVPKPTA